MLSQDLETKKKQIKKIVLVLGSLIVCAVRSR